MSGTPTLVLGEAERRERVNAVWSVAQEERAQVQGWYWMAHPMVAARVNTLISGDPHCDAYGRLERLCRERGWRLPIRHALSLGCGFGNLERDLMRRGWVESIDAYDLAEGAIQEARRLAEEGGFANLRYHVADLDSMRIEPGSVDAVFAHSSVHHVRELERLYAAVHAALRPGGVFHLHEFVGPTRFQWTDAQLHLVNEFLDGLPPRLRRLPSGMPKGAMTRPTVEAMIAADPSEAVRSAELVAALEPGFEIVELRRSGGALAHLALGDIAQNFDPALPEDQAFLERLFALEDRMMAEGVIGSDFAVITAVPRAHVRPAQATPSDGPAMKPPLATSVSLLFPPARRLYHAVRGTNAAVSSLKAEQDRIAASIGELRAEQQRLSREVARLSDALASVRQAAQPRAAAQASAPTAGPAAAADTAELDRARAAAGGAAQPALSAGRDRS